MSDEPIQPIEQFARDLGAIYHADVNVPASIDDAILNRARAHFARSRSRSRVLRIGALVSAAAAMIVVAIYIAKPQAVKTVPLIAVNITDALRVARDIRAGGRMSRATISTTTASSINAT